MLVKDREQVLEADDVLSEKNHHNLRPRVPSLLHLLGPAAVLAAILAESLSAPAANAILAGPTAAFLTPATVFAELQPLYVL